MTKPIESNGEKYWFFFTRCCMCLLFRPAPPRPQRLWWTTLLENHWMREARRRRIFMPCWAKCSGQPVYYSRNLCEHLQFAPAKWRACWKQIVQWYLLMPWTLQCKSKFPFLEGLLFSVYRLWVIQIFQKHWQQCLDNKINIKLEWERNSDGLVSY